MKRVAYLNTARTEEFKNGKLGNTLLNLVSQIFVDSSGLIQMQKVNKWKKKAVHSVLYLLSIAGKIYRRAK